MNVWILSLLLAVFIILAIKFKMDNIRLALAFADEMEKGDAHVSELEFANRAWEQGQQDLEEVYEQQILSLQEEIDRANKVIGYLREDLQEAVEIVEHHSANCLLSYGEYEIEYPLENV